MARRHHYEVRALALASTPVRATALVLEVPADTDLSGALCAEVSAEVFFPELGEDAGEEVAKRICLACPVRSACLDLAIARNDRYGVFGGLTTAERDDLVARPNGCGTRGGYRRHQNFGEPPCLPCRAANTADSAARRNKAARPAAAPHDLEAAA